MINTIWIVLGLAMALFAFRLFAGPSLSDRVIALDGMLWTGIAFLVVQAASTGSVAYLPVAVVLTFVGFIATAVVGRFIEGRGG